MPESIGLEAALEMQEFQRGVDKYLAEIEKMNRQTTSVAGALTDNFANLGKAILGVGAALTTAVGVGAGIALSKFEAFTSASIDEASKLEQQLADIAAVLNDTVEAVEPLRSIIQELAIDPKLKVNTFGAADAIELLARNGIALEDIMNGAAKATIAMSTATGGDLQESAAVVTDILNVFGLAAQDVGDIVGAATAVVNQTKFDLNDYFLALSNGAAVSQNAGVSFEDFNAALIGVSSAFNTGRRAGTGLGTAMLNLVPKSKAAAQIMAALGMITEEGTIKFYDAQGAFLGIENAAQVLQDTLGGLSEAERSFYIRQVFGIDAQEAIIRLMELGAEGIKKIKADIGNVDAFKASETRMNTLLGKWEIFLGIIEATRVQFGFHLLPGLKRGLDVVNTSLNENFAQFDSLGRVMGELLDRLVTKLTPLIQSWIPKFAAASEKLADYLFELIDSGDVLNNLWEDLPQPLRRVIEYVQRAAKFFGDLGRWVWYAGKQIMAFADPFIEWMKANVTFEDILTVATIAIGAFIAPLITAIIQLGAFAVAAVAATTFIRQHWESDWMGIRTALTTAMDYILKTIQLLANGEWRMVWEEMKTAATKAFNDIVAYISAVDYSALFNNLQAEVETRLAPIRVKIEEELKKLDVVGIAEGWAEKLDAAFGISTTSASIVQQFTDRFGEIKTKLLTFKQDVETEIEAIKVVMLTYWAALTEPMPTTGETTSELPFITQIYGVREKINSFKADLEKAQTFIDDFKANLDKTKKTVESVYTAIMENPLVQWVIDNVGVTEFVAGLGAAWLLLNQNIWKTNTGIAAMAIAFGLGIGQIKTAWETNWAGIKTFTLTAWPEIEKIGKNLLAIGQKIWDKLGPTTEEAVRLLLTAIEELLKGLNAGLEAVRLSLEPGGAGDKILTWFLTDLPAALTPSKTETENLAKAFDGLKESLGELVAYLFSEEFGGKLQGLSDYMGLDLFYTDLANLITILDFVAQAIKAAFTGNLGAVKQEFEAWQKLAEEQRRAQWESRDRGEQEFDYLPLYKNSWLDPMRNQHSGTEAGESLVKGLLDGTKTLEPSLVSLTSDIDMSWGAALDTVSKNTLEKGAEIGGNLVQGIFDGWAKKNEALIAGAALIGAVVLRELKGVLEIESPSKATTVIGEQTVEGLIQGIDNKKKALETKIAEMVQWIMDTLHDKLGIESGDATSKSVDPIGQAAVQGFMDGVDGKKKALELKMADMVKWVIDMLNTKLGILPGAVASSSETKKIGQAVAQGFMDGIDSKMAAIQAKIAEMGNVAPLTAVVQTFYTAGQSVVQGFIDGISNKMGEVQTKLTELVNAAATATATAAQIASPSKLFQKLGQQTGEGYLLGLDESFAKMLPMLATTLASTVSSLDTMSRSAQTVSGAPSYANYYRNNSTAVTNANSFGPFQVNNGMDVAQMVQLMKQVVNESL